MAKASQIPSNFALEQKCQCALWKVLPMRIASGSASPPGVILELSQQNPEIQEELLVCLLRQLDKAPKRVC